jgi:hypothetical protein
MAETWRRCSACKRPIELGGTYYTCSVSTCNRARTALVFCSVDCWEIHLPTERHRDAWAVEQRAPTTAEPPEDASSAPRRRAARPPAKGAGGSSDREILVVASRLKAYVRGRAGFNTSDAVLPILSDALRRLCDEAIRNARRAERQTVLDRDVPEG